jgi:hypothetical protein
MKATYPKTCDEIDFENNDEEEIKHHVLVQLNKEGRLYPVSNRDDILRDVIKATKCDMKHARMVLQKMDELGLELCCDSFFSYYDLKKFALLRDYITPDEAEEIDKKMERAGDDSIKKQMDEDPEFADYIEDLIEKYGQDKKNWKYDTI